MSTTVGVHGAAAQESLAERLYPRTRSFVAGWASGVALVLAGHPFDTVKVRLQTQGVEGRFRGPLDCVRQTVVKEGFFGLYKGAAPPLVMTGFINSMLFGLQAQAVRAVVGGASRSPTTLETMEAAIISGTTIFAVRPGAELAVHHARRRGVECFGRVC
jgi:solute carrier family 25 carnitine/acylcarnitine transporter 20/29